MAFFQGGAIGGGAGGGQITLDQISGAFGNFKYIDEATDLQLVSGEREIPAGYTIEFVDNAITGMAPVFLEPLRIQDDQNCVIQAFLTLNAIVYLGTGYFVNRNGLGFYIQNNIIVATPFAEMYNIVNTNFTPGFDASFGAFNFAYIGQGGGIISGLDVVIFETFNLVDWTNTTKVINCTQVQANAFGGSSLTLGLGAELEISGDKTRSVTVTSGILIVQTGQAYIDVRPSVNDDAVLVFTSNQFNAAFGGDFFLVGIQGAISAYANNSSSGTTDSYADNGAGGTTVFSAQTSPGNGRKVTIASSTNFDGTHAIFNDVPGVSFDIPVAYAVGGTAGTWNFNSVIVTTSAPHGLTDGDAVQISKSTNYNFGRVIFNASGSVYSIDDVPYNGDDAAGVWDSGSLKQNDPRVVCAGNGDQPDSSQLLAVDITITETLTGTSTGDGALITSWATNIDNQYTVNPPGQALGTVRYDGRDIQGGIILSCAYIANGGGNPQANISFRIFRSTGGGGFLQINSDIPGFLINREDTVSWPVESPLLKGDLLQVRVYDAGNNAIDIVSASLISKADGQGV